MKSRDARAEALALSLRGVDKLRIEEIFRLGVLRDGVHLLTTDIRLPILGQVIPRIELELSGPGFLKKVTVRVNQRSPFGFDGERLTARINGADVEVACVQFLDDSRAPTGMYNFGLLRENGMRSFVFDYHTYCAYSCDFCFKESEWEVLAVEGRPPANYQANFEECLEYVGTHQAEFATKYDIVWLCTGSITNWRVELDRHRRMAQALRSAGYAEGIYVSQVIPAKIRHDQPARKEYLSALRESGVSLFNIGVEIVGTEYRKKYVHGYKGTLVFEDYVAAFSDAIEVFGHHNVGSCLLAGIEPAEDTLRGLRTLAELGVVPSPTVLTPFVVSQERIEFMYDLDGLLDVHLAFYEIIREYDLPVFSGVFSLA